MTSIKTQLPFDYYAVPICKPENLQYKPENLGKWLCSYIVNFINV